MSGVWDLSSDDFAHLRGYGGQRFVQMMNALLRAEAMASNVAVAAVHLTERVNEGDGGVDAVVESPLTRPFATSAPGSFWQFKGADARSIGKAKLKSEIAKQEVQRRLSEGLEYVICVCDDLPAAKLREREEWLSAEVRRKAPNAPRPRILTIGHLITWLSSHPGVVASHLRMNMQGVRGHASWLAETRALLMTYVALPSRAAFARDLSDFAERTDIGSPVWALAADSGMGATRFVAESLLQAADKVVVVEANEALRTARALLGRDQVTALLVVDRASMRLRERLEEALRGASARVRAVVIHEPSEPVESALRLEAPEGAEIEEILKQNFTRLGLAERRAIVHIADGVIKVGAHLARAAGEGQRGWLQHADAWAADQLTMLVDDPHDSRVLRALALFGRVGMAGEIEAQVEHVAARFGLDVQGVRSSVHTLSRRGLVSIGPRYVRVRPRLFAKVCFNHAWSEIAPQYSKWRSDLSVDLHSSFLRQAARVASEKARSVIAKVELSDLGELVPSDMLQETRAQRLLLLLALDPLNLTRHVAELVEQMTADQLCAPGDRLEYWNARLHWVRALQDLMSSNTTYELAESALFRFARAEPSPDLANGGGIRRGEATEGWLDSYSMFLSGTPVPITVRLKRLVRKLESDPDTAPWVIAALSRALAPHASKFVGSPLVAGDVRPSDWQPRTYGEWKDGRIQAIRLLGRCLRIALHRGRAFAVFVRLGGHLLEQGHVDDLREVLDTADLDAAERSQVRHFVGRYLEHEGKQVGKVAEEGIVPMPSDVQMREAYLARVRAWSSALEPQGFLQHLLETLQASEGAGGQASEPLDELAAAFFEEDFATVMACLRREGRHFYRLYDFGVSLGSRDRAAALLAGLIAPAVESPVLLARGYLEGLSHFPEHDDLVRATLDALELESPRWCLELALAHPRAGTASERALRLVRAGRLPMEALASVNTIRYRGERWREALQVVLEDSGAVELRANVALALCEHLITCEGVLPGDGDTQVQIWRVLELASECDGDNAHVWGALFSYIAPTNPHRAAKLACEIAEEGEHFLANQAASALANLATTHATTVLEAIGQALLRMEEWRVGLSKTAGVLSSIDDDLFFSWLERHGLPAARALAFHLPEPRVDDDGVPACPPRTERFLMTFGRDPEVIENFCHPPFRHGLYSGDIAAQHEQEAARARPFLNHVQPAVRRWANREVQGGEHSAEYWGKVEEERRGRDL